MQKPIESVKLSRREKHRLLDDLARAQAPRPVESCRRAIRVAFPCETVMLIVHRAGTRPVSFTVTPRNLSVRGIAVLHGQYVYVGSDATVLLPMLDGQMVKITGRIVACRHVAGVVHEVSMSFEAAVDLNDFVELDTELSSRCRADYLGQTLDKTVTAKAATLYEGSALLIGPHTPERKQHALWLQTMGLHVAEATKTARARQLVHERPRQIVFMDLDQPQAEPAALIADLRDAGYEGPIIALTGPGHDDAQAAASAAGCQTCLAKPMDLAALQATLDDLLKAA